MPDAVTTLKTSDDKAAEASLLPLFVIAAGTVTALSGAIALWAYFCTTLFFEMVRTGFMACFG
jgi:uncharacterized membrane protein